MAARRDAADLVDVGAYVPGANPLTDAALAAAPAIDAFLRQDVDDTTALDQAWAELAALVAATPIAGATSGGAA